MQIFIYLLLALSVTLFAEDYDFNLDEIEVKPYEYSGYLKGEHKYQKLNADSSQYGTKNKNYMNSYFGEANLKFKYFADEFKLESEFMANYSDIDSDQEDVYTINQLYFNYKPNQNHIFDIGKKSLKWGKGYFFNPVAFLDRKKDPNDPENSREGYVLANYKYNKSYQGDLKNFSFDIVMLKNDEDINSDFDGLESNRLALKAYFLYFDTDIDLIYQYANSDNNKIGIDFSKNLLTNFEIHGEFAKNGNSSYSYLLGLKYLTEFDLTITSEYFYQKYELAKSKPFWDNRYLINKLSQKEPLDIIYSSVYFKNSLNMDDNSYQNSFGATYSFKNNIELDVSYIDNTGRQMSEYGSKLVDNLIWTKVTWYF